MSPSIICSALNISPEQLVTLQGALPRAIFENDDIKPLLIQIINNMDKKKVKALYSLVLAFIDAVEWLFKIEIKNDN